MTNVTIAVEPTHRHTTTRYLDGEFYSFCACGAQSEPGMDANDADAALIADHLDACPEPVATLDDALLVDESAHRLRVVRGARALENGSGTAARDERIIQRIRDLMHVAIDDGHSAADLIARAVAHEFDAARAIRS